MIKFKSKNLILLTGAGFTKNFGGFVGSEMWEQIFNDPEIQKNEKLRSLLQEDYDFESVYSTVMAGKFSDEEKDIMKRVTEKAYKNLDDATKVWVFNDSSPYPVNWYGVMDLTNLFAGDGNEKGLFFTLNQDIFLERRCGYRSPGVPFFPESIYHNRLLDLNSSQFVALPHENVDKKFEDALKNQAGLSYIKLHGSYGWKSSDGNNQMVIGKNKSELIEKEPLLKCYLELFKKVITEGDKKILIIGYGFGDQHINQILVEGVEKYGLQIHIITTRPMVQLRKHFDGGHVYALPILKGIRGYYTQELKDIFPKNQEETVHFKKIREDLLRKS